MDPAQPNATNKDQSGSRSLLGLALRIGRLIVWLAALIASLLAFPNVLPWVLGAWLLLFSVNFTMQSFTYNLLCRSEFSKGWAGLAFIPVLILTLVLIKWPPPSEATILFCCGIAGLLILVVLGRDDTRNGRDIPIAPTLAIVWLLWGAGLFFHFDDATASQLVGADPRRPVVCLGDSLTDYGYPEFLADRINLPVEDFGFNGYTTEDGIELLPDIVALNPQCVVLELGGHDYREGKPRAKTKRNLELIIETLRASNCNVVIVEIPRGFISDPYYGLERQLAAKHDLQLIPDTMIRRLIFWSPIIPPGTWVDREKHNSEDGLHPNENGNRMMAGYVSRALARVFGEGILN